MMSGGTLGGIGSIMLGQPLSYIRGAPPLIPDWPSRRATEDEDFDRLIRLTWRLQVAGELTWRGAGQLHNALTELRGLANPRERRGLQ